MWSQEEKNEAARRFKGKTEQELKRLFIKGNRQTQWLIQCYMNCVPSSWEVALSQHLEDKQNG